MGVWIEMTTKKLIFGYTKVTPFVGVWIEILAENAQLDILTRHSLCGSVDWNISWKCTTWHFNAVTPFVGVWIEMLSLTVFPSDDTVTPFVGVWIEIKLCQLCEICVAVTPFVGVWIEIPLDKKVKIERVGHSLCGSVDWNSSCIGCLYVVRCHSLCGSVDWNSVDIIVIHQPNTVTPFVGVWIEIIVLLAHLIKKTCHSLRGSVDWNSPITADISDPPIVTPFVGVWIEIPVSCT